ncbi:MAG: hypothetical protein ACLUKN_04715 [Bacilli bacterium]
MSYLETKEDFSASIIELETLFKQLFGYKFVNVAGILIKILTRPIRQPKKPTVLGGTRLRGIVPQRACCVPKNKDGIVRFAP